MRALRRTAKALFREETPGSAHASFRTDYRWPGPVLIGTVSAKGWVVIPKELRTKLGLGKGSRVRFRETEGKVTIERVPDAQELFGSLSGVPSLIDDIEADHAAEALLEERKFANLDPA